MVRTEEEMMVSDTLVFVRNQPLQCFEDIISRRLVLRSKSLVVDEQRDHVRIVAAVI